MMQMNSASVEMGNWSPSLSGGFFRISHLIKHSSTGTLPSFYLMWEWSNLSANSSTSKVTLTSALYIHWHEFWWLFLPNLITPVTTQNIPITWNFFFVLLRLISDPSSNLHWQLMFWFIFIVFSYFWISWLELWAILLIWMTNAYSLLCLAFVHLFLLSFEWYFIL